MFLLRTPAFRREARANLALALPLVAAQISFVSMGTVDTLVAGRMGAAELAAVAVGANLWFLFFVLFMGLFMACSPIVAQGVGAGRPAPALGAFVRGALGLALLAGLVWMLALRLAIEPALDLLDLEATTRAYAAEYLRVVSWSAVPFCLGFALRNAAEGQGLTQAALWAGLLGGLVNAVAACVLGFGLWGAPQLGPVGCGWAMVLASLAMLASYAGLYHWHPRLQPMAALRRGPLSPWNELREILYLGGPIAAILAAEAWLFLGGALLMARFGESAVAAHQVAINFASITFMVPLSVGMATTVRVGHAVGAGQHGEVRLRGQTGIVLGAAFALLSASIMALLPQVIARAYTSVAEVAAAAAGFLYLAALFQVFDCVQATANGALRGLKDTRLPMLITVSAYWIVGMPLAVVLAFHSPVGPAGIWWGFIAGLAVAAVGLALRFHARSAFAARRVPPA
ncbi:MAG TPA: MATE family efflux transporter [Solimonas sp.]|nr:MATE family efflux transporter [Solimonas sp.]